jgi:hypothetical protein
MADWKYDLGQEYWALYEGGELGRKVYLAGKLAEAEERGKIEALREAELAKPKRKPLTDLQFAALEIIDRLEIPVRKKPLPIGPFIQNLKDAITAELAKPEQKPLT